MQEPEQTGSAQDADPPNKARQSLGRYVSDPQAPSPQEVQRLAQELETARAQLEIQSWQLRDVARQELAEEALAESEERFRAIALYTYGWESWIGPEGRLLWVNPAVERVTGYTPQECLAMGNYPVCLVHADDRELAADWCREAMRQQSGSDRRIRIRKKDGSIVWVAVSWQPIYAADGACLGYRTSARDITERKQAEDALAESRVEIAAILESAPILIVLLDKQRRVRKVNRATVEFAGRNSGELVQARIGEALRCLHSLDDPQGCGYGPSCRQCGLRAAVLDTIQTGQSHCRTEITLPLRRGPREQQLTFLVSTTPTRIPRGDMVLVCLEDITDRRRAREQIESLARFSSENPNPVLRVRSDGVLLYANPASESLLERWNRRVGQRVPDVWAKLVADAFKSGKPRQTEATHAGAVLSVEIVPLKQAGYANLYASDVTKRKQAEQALEEKAAELARSNRELEQFAYVASHDLQEPLRMVTGYVQLLQRRYQDRLDADADEFIHYAVDGASHMQTLIKDLLAYSRVGTHGGRFQTVDSQAVLDQALANLRARVAESDALITHDPLPIVVADGSQLMQVFQNLIGNAIKFRSERRAEIHVGARRNHQRWVFFVRDNGIGIEPQYAQRIMMVFQRLHDRRKYPGTGIGLAICRKIVQRRGGDIWVESRPGEGSTFCFTIPDRPTDGDLNEHLA